MSKTSLSKCLSGTESLVIDSQTMSVHESLLSEVLRESNDQVPRDLKREELSAVDEEEYYWKVMDRGEGEERYREEREIGAGGMGTVNLVFDADFFAVFRDEGHSPGDQVQARGTRRLHPRSSHYGGTRTSQHYPRA